jgi:glutathione S-transferase
LPQPTLYYSRGACSLAVHIVLEEIGAAYSLAHVSVSGGATQSPEFLSVNPKGRVPVLDIGGFVLTEAPAILLYLSLSHPEKALVSKDPESMARCVEWLNWLSSAVHAVGFGELWRPQRFIADPSLFEQISAKGRQNVADAYSLIESKLQDRSWAVGDAFSCVDPFLLVFYMWGNRIGMSMRTLYPAWTVHTESTYARPAVRAALSQEDISVW